MEPHDANGLEPRIRGHDQVSAEAAEEFIGKDQYAPLTQPLSCEAVGGRPHHQSRCWRPSHPNVSHCKGVPVQGKSPEDAGKTDQLTMLHGTFP
jgi:hypothetical protein